MLIKNDNLIFENYIIFEGRIVQAPVKVKVGDQTYYNFRVDNNKFGINCTITRPENEISENNKLEENIFDSLLLERIVKVRGSFTIKRKADKLWYQINVKAWTVTAEDNKREGYTV